MTFFYLFMQGFVFFLIPSICCPALENNKAELKWELCKKQKLETICVATKLKLFSTKGNLITIL